MPELNKDQFQQPGLFDGSDYESRAQPGGLMGADWYRDQRRNKRRTPMGELAGRQRSYDHMDERAQELSTRPVGINPDARNPYHAPRPGDEWNQTEGYVQQAGDELYDEMMGNTRSGTPYAQAHYEKRGFNPRYAHKFTGTEQIPTQEFGPGGSIASHQHPQETDMGHAAMMQGVQGLPPVEVEEYPSGMGLKDGNHRVTEALRNGRLWVDAHVSRLDYDVKEPGDPYEGY